MSWHYVEAQDTRFRCPRSDFCNYGEIGFLLTSTARVAVSFISYYYIILLIRTLGTN